jgi:hypothetical protein
MGRDNPWLVSQYRNTLAKIAELSGFKDSDQFYAPHRVELKAKIGSNKQRLNSKGHSKTR